MKEQTDKIRSSITVNEYHQRSKHHLQQYALGPDSLDWDTQPDPFRQFNGSPRFSMPLPAKNLIVDFNDLYHHERIKPSKIDLNTLGALFELSLGLSAWKVYGADRWALRINPSSGNLHPTEAYIVLPDVNIIPAGIYHYHSYEHCLEQRCNLKKHAETISGLLGEQQLLIGLSSIHWREAWKYGERAFRYCQHDVGHAIGAIRYAAGLLGWQVQLLEHLSDAQITALLGLDRHADFSDAETEVPDVLLRVGALEHPATIDIGPPIEATGQAEWKGRANRLSPDNRITWEVIEKASTACEKPQTPQEKWTPPNSSLLTQSDTSFDASMIIRQRRSAQELDGQSELSLTAFYRILDSLLPRAHTTPFDVLTWQPRIHLVLFVHRVQGLKPGSYILLRDESAKAPLKNILRNEFDWSRPPICPESLPLYHLVSANSQNASRTVSCHQNIASDGAFCVSMLGQYQQTIEDKPWQYRQLFWEAGLIGQCLYLEAEAAGVRGTGIGCYFDDAVHDTLGIKDNTFQVIYHFTVGTPLSDSRLISLPPYGHLKTD